MPGDLNYRNAFISVAADCPVAHGTVPPERGGKPTVAAIQFALLADRPYELTSEDVLFESSTARRSLPTHLSAHELALEQAAFLTRPQACMRASPLPKRYGWGLHCDGDGRLALVGVETDDYERLSGDRSLRQLRAFRSSRP